MRQASERYGGDGYDREGGLYGGGGGRPAHTLSGDIPRSRWKFHYPGSENSRMPVKLGRIQQIDKYSDSAAGNGHFPLRAYVCRSGDVPVCPGAALRPKFPPPAGFARAILLQHKSWRAEEDLMAEADDTWSPELSRFLESESRPMALKVSVERAPAQRCAGVTLPVWILRMSTLSGQSTAKRRTRVSGRILRMSTLSGQSTAKKRTRVYAPARTATRKIWAQI